MLNPFPHVRLCLRLHKDAKQLRHRRRAAIPNPPKRHEMAAVRFSPLFCFRDGGRLLSLGLVSRYKRRFYDIFSYISENNGRAGVHLADAEGMRRLCCIAFPFRMNFDPPGRA